MAQSLYKKSRLPNGIRVVTERVPASSAVSVGIWVNAGSRDEPEELSGISHFIEHMIFKGTENRTALEIAKTFDRLGGFSNAFTSKETTCFHAKVMESHLDTVMDLLADIFLNSVFHPVEVERERQVILQEISMVEDSPDDLIHELFSRHFWRGNQVERSILGTPETVSTIRPDTLKQHMRDFYVGDRVVVSAAGCVDHDEFVKRVEALFSEVPGRMSPNGRQRPRPHYGLKTHRKELEQTHMLLGMPGPEAGNPERYKYLLMNVILGGSMSSRLFQEIREKYGLAYAVYSFISSFEDAGMLGIYAGVAPENSAKVMELAIREMEKLADNSLDEQELDHAKDHVKGGLLLSSENSDSRMSKIARDELYLGRFVSYDELVEKIDAVSREDIRQCAQECISNGLAAVLLGQVSQEQEQACRQIIESRKEKEDKV